MIVPCNFYNYFNHSLLNYPFLIVLFQLLRNRADVNFINEHGNSPLHYACFWGYQGIAEDLVAQGGLVSLANKDGDTPLDKARGHLAKRLHGMIYKPINNLMSNFATKHSHNVHCNDFRTCCGNWTRPEKNYF